MLINAQRSQQLRVAIVDGALLKDYQVEITDRDLTRGNIYRGVVANIQPSLNAAFIDIGEERHGFLPVADVLPSCFHKQPPADVRRPRIDQVLEKGKTVVVQVTKDGVGQKGPALTTNIALAGRYLVLTPFDDVRGISRKAEDDDARKKIRGRLKKLSLPEEHGVIVRTNGLEQNQTTLNRDLNALLRLWRKIKTEIGKGRGPRFLYSDQDLVVQALRDYLDTDIGEVVVDSPDVHSKVENYLATFMPRSKPQLTLYQERLPLFSRFRLETQIDRIYERTAPLPSGGYIVIDATEALTAIDVNSGRATRNANHDESIFNTNLEAAAEVARQLRLRDIGGLVVIDFIDMRLRKHKNKLEKEMRDAMKIDKARYSVGRISSNGLMEINRQRIKQAIRLRTHRPCPTCQGVGTIASAEFHALNLLGRIESRVATGLIDRVTIALHPEIADALQNHHRIRLAQLEDDLDLHIEIISAPELRRLEERLDFHQREGGAVLPTKGPALTATDLTVPKEQQRKRGAAADDEEGASPSRRRKRRRRRSRSRDEVEAPVEAREDSTAEEASADTEEVPAAKPRSRRRSRRKTSETEGEAEAPIVEAEAEAQAANEEKPKKRPSRRRRRSEASEDGAPVEAQETSPNDGESSDAEEPRSRSRRRRRRKPTDEGPDEVETQQDEDLGNRDEGESRRRRRRRGSRSRRRTGETDGNVAPPPRQRAAAEANGNRKPKSGSKSRTTKSPKKGRGGKSADGNTAATPLSDNDISLDRVLPGSHDPSSPPPKRTGSTAAQLRWQWLGGPGGSKGSPDAGSDAGSDS